MNRDNEVQERMFELVEQWKRSNQSQASFCRERGLGFHTFYYWYKKYKRLNTPADLPVAPFVKLTVNSAAPAPAGIEVSLPNGISVLFHSPVNADYLKAVIS